MRRSTRTGFTPNGQRLLWPKLYALSLLGLYLVFTFAHRQPPLLGDLGDWAAQGALLARHMRGLPDAFHTLKPYPVPNTAVTVLLGLLMLVFSWSAAIKVFVALQFCLSFLAILRLAQVSCAPAYIYVLAPGVVFLGVNLWFGFAAFQLALAQLMFFSAMLLSGKPPRPGRVALSLLFLFFTHMVPFTFACLLLLTYAWQRRRPRVLIALAPSALCLSLYALGRFHFGDPDATAVLPGSLRYGSPLFLLYKVNSLLKSFGLANPVDTTQHSLAAALLGRPVFACLLLANLLLAATVFYLVVRAGIGGFQDPARRPLWVAIVVALPAYLFLPQTLLGISDPGSRVLQTLLCLALFLMRGPRAAWRIAVTCSVTLACAGLFLFANLAGNSPRTAAAAHLPLSLDLLAKAPYAYGYERYVQLEQRRYNEPIFPTALFTNQPQPPASTK